MGYAFYFQYKTDPCDVFLLDLNTNKCAYSAYFN